MQEREIYLAWKDIIMVIWLKIRVSMTSFPLYLCSWCFHVFLKNIPGVLGIVYEIFDLLSNIGLFDLGTAYIWAINMNNCNALCSVSDKQNRPDRNLDLSFFFRYKHITSLKKLPSPAPGESLPYWFHGNFAAMFVLSYWLREFLLSALANRVELRCEPKQLMLLYYKIYPRWNGLMYSGSSEANLIFLGYLKISRTDPPPP